MNSESFQSLAETWGSDLQRWPEDVREAAKRFAGTPLGASILAEMAAEDELLAGPSPGPAQTGRSIAAVNARIAGGTRRLPGWLRLAFPPAVLASAAVFGVVAALGTTPVNERGPVALLALTMSYSDPLFVGIGS